jgi:type VI protein secretion system component VasF
MLSSSSGEGVTRLRIVSSIRRFDAELMSGRMSAARLMSHEYVLCTCTEARQWNVRRATLQEFP